MFQIFLQYDNNSHIYDIHILRDIKGISLQLYLKYLILLNPSAHPLELNYLNNSIFPSIK